MEVGNISFGPDMLVAKSSRCKLLTTTKNTKKNAKKNTMTKIYQKFLLFCSSTMLLCPIDPEMLVVARVAAGANNLQQYFRIQRSQPTSASLTLKDMKK